MNNMARGSSNAVINQLPLAMYFHIWNIAPINLDHLSLYQIGLYLTDPSHSPASLAQVIDAIPSIIIPDTPFESCGIYNVRKNNALI